MSTKKLKACGLGTALAVVASLLMGGIALAQDTANGDGFPADTPVYYSGGPRGHIEGCPRLSAEAKAAGPNTTFAEMKAKGGMLCSRCPGSELNKQREAAAGKNGRGEGAPKQQSPGVAYDPNTTVYCDALWFRVHAEDCPELILREKKKTLTLEEADKAGCRIGESGQSGRENCCFPGYRRKYPEKKLTDDTLLCGDARKDRYKHVAGCHRYWPDRSDMRRPMKEWVADGFAVCPHCIERGPSVATMTDEAWNQLGSSNKFVAPEGWVPKPYSVENYPSKEELEILIRETLSKGNGIQELQFTDPVATAENFMTMRFFFPVGQWLDLYMAYRATGDKRLLETLLESARHYRKLSLEFPSVAQAKASDPEGLPFMFSMAAYSRITLQLARKQPGAVGEKEIGEAEAFLKTMVSVLKPTCEGNDALDPEMGVPRKLADDFRSRAFNRAMNGIGTLGMTAAALEDLQALKKTQEYQPTIDRYRKVVQEYIRNFFKEGHLCTKVAGRPMFVYPYVAGKIREEDGCPIFKRPEDAGHYSHTLQGLVFLYESVPETGIDDNFMTAVANAIYRSSTEKVMLGAKKGKDKKSTLSGHVECSTAATARPFGSTDDRHTYSPARERFYVLEAFRDGVIDAQCITLSAQQKEAANGDYDHRLATLYAQYVKALRKDRNLVHIGEGKQNSAWLK